MTQDGECETDPTDPNNCGACGRSCQAACSGGSFDCVCENGDACGILEEAEFMACCSPDEDNPEGCVDLKNDNLHCGACGNDCTANGQVCVLGACQAPCRLELVSPMPETWVSIHEDSLLTLIFTCEAVGSFQLEAVGSRSGNLGELTVQKDAIDVVIEATELFRSFPLQGERVTFLIIGSEFQDEIPLLPFQWSYFANGSKSTSSEPPAGVFGFGSYAPSAFSSIFDLKQTGEASLLSLAPTKRWIQQNSGASTSPERFSWSCDTGCTVSSAIDSPTWTSDGTLNFDVSGQGILDVEFVDINGDGAPEVAVAASNRFSIYAEASGTELYIHPNPTHDAAFGDLDNDGDLDLVLALGSLGVEVALNDGTGAFSTIASPNVLAYGVELIDRDDDGDLDAFFLTDKDAKAHIESALNDSIGNLTIDHGMTLGSEITDTSWSYAGRLEEPLIFAVGTRGELKTVLWRDGIFEDPVIHPLANQGYARPQRIYDLASADLLGDGTPEIVLLVGEDNDPANFPSPHETRLYVQIFFTFMAGPDLIVQNMDKDIDFDGVVDDVNHPVFLEGFELSDFLQNEVTPPNIVLADMNGDRAIDIVAGGEVWLNAVGPLPLSTSPQAYTTNDFTRIVVSYSNDDLVPTSFLPGLESVLQGASPHRPISIQNSGSILSAVSNGGFGTRMDLSIPRGSYFSELSARPFTWPVWENGMSKLHGYEQDTVTTDTGHYHTGAATFDDNASIDLLIASGSNARLFIPKVGGGGSDSWTDQERYSLSANVSDIVTGDINADGRMDAIATTANGFAHFFHNPSSSAILDVQELNFPSATVNATGALADLDGDRDLDFIYVPLAPSGTTAAPEIYFFDHEDNTFTRSAQTFAVTGQLGQLATGDLDKDGDIDVAIANKAQGVFLMINEGNGLFRTKSVLGNTTGEINGVAFYVFGSTDDIDLIATGNTGTFLYQRNNNTSLDWESTTNIRIGGAVGHQVKVFAINDDPLLDVAVLSDAPVASGRTGREVNIFLGVPANPPAPPGFSPSLRQVNLGDSPTDFEMLNVNADMGLDILGSTKAPLLRLWCTGSACGDCGDFQEDPNNCGYCGNMCQTGKVCRGGSCVDP